MIMQYSETIRITGLVQGVGFRPTVCKLAQQHHITGEIKNDGAGVHIIATANANNLDTFVQHIQQYAPALARIDHIQRKPLSPARQFKQFSIIHSVNTPVDTQIAADARTCDACLNDINNTQNRRFAYPFTNCTHCGPRLSIIQALPYDRAHTSMSAFTQCPDCQHEYNDPKNRRFHAQPNACPKCGPHITLRDAQGKTIACQTALTQITTWVKQGKILAIKGIGGYQLACDAQNQQAIKTLRKRKQRPAKAFALMAQSIQQIKQHCHVQQAEVELLNSSAAPIVLLQKHHASTLPNSIAPHQQTLGFMLPNSPLHHLIMQQLDTPLLLTSGNIAHQPQCTDNQQAMQQLNTLADYFIDHNRAIINRVDDSVLRIIYQKPQFYRRARGYAPHAIHFQHNPMQAQILACGSEIKNTFCLVKQHHATMSQHIGHLNQAATYEDFCQTIQRYQQLYQITPDVIAVDLHPEYHATKFGKALAKQQHIRLIETQHHHAHIASCLADNAWSAAQGKVIGIALDGLGYGDDQTLWGGEILIANYQSYQRIAHLKYTPLIGGNQASIEPWRNAYAHLYTHLSWASLSQQYATLKPIQNLNEKPLNVINNMLKNGLNTPLSSSCGRLFDAVAFMLGLCPEQQSYEGQAAIELEHLIQDNDLIHATPYPFKLNSTVSEIDPKPMWQALLQDLQQQCSTSIIASRFHLGLAHSICAVVQHHSHTTHIKTVALSGGVMQNKTLLELCQTQLEQQSLNVLTQTQVPANDGGLALGQAAIAAAQLDYNQESSLCV